MEIIRVFDFFFRGFILLGTVIGAISNFKIIKKNRINNENKKTIRYYNSRLQTFFPFLEIITSALIGFSLFRVGSFVQVYDTGVIQIKFLDYVLVDKDSVGAFALPIIFIGSIGALGYLFFCILQNLSFLKLGEYFSLSIDIKEDHKLIKDGIYGIIRHPIYLSELMLPLCASFAMQSWQLLLWSIVIVLPKTIKKVKMEDELLEDYFQQEFLDYKAKVGGLFPIIKKK